MVTQNSMAIITFKDNNKNKTNHHNNYNNQHCTYRRTDTAGFIPDRDRLHHVHQSRFYQLVRVGVGGVHVPEGSSQGSSKGSSTRSSSGTAVKEMQE
jgi:hypothetical protein